MFRAFGHAERGSGRVIGKDTPHQCVNLRERPVLRELRTDTPGGGNLASGQVRRPNSSLCMRRQCRELPASAIACVPGWNRHCPPRVLVEVAAAGAAGPEGFFESGRVQHGNQVTRFRDANRGAPIDLRIHHGHASREPRRGGQLPRADHAEPGVRGLSHLRPQPSGAFRAPTVELRHVPRRQLAAPHRRAGNVTRALAWLAPEEVEDGLEAVPLTLSEEDRNELSAAQDVMPIWMAESVRARLSHS